MKKDFSPTKRQEEHEKPVSSILLAATAGFARECGQGFESLV
jgi:hypothetical protein